MNGFDQSRKGDIYTAHSTITASATSAEIDITGYNAILESTIISGTGTWKIDIQGRLNSDGTVMDIYDNNDNQLTTDNITASRMKLFVALPNLITVVATEVDGTANCTVTIQPINV